jgi:hypothetical protein
MVRTRSCAARGAYAAAARLPVMPFPLVWVISLASGPCRVARRPMIGGTPRQPFSFLVVPCCGRRRFPSRPVNRGGPRGSRRPCSAAPGGALSYRSASAYASLTVRMAY